VIREAATDPEVSVTFPIMHQLRPHLEEGEYIEVVRRLRSSGYRLAFATEGEKVRCVAGFRIVEFLAHGRFLYVDDLVTAEDARSTGHGKRMLDWLLGVAREEVCSTLQLDSGVQRHGAHRFYMRENMHIFGYHFSKAV
jgi:GNAT superfamily N-acetyltransferase